MQHDVVHLQMPKHDFRKLLRDLVLSKRMQAFPIWWLIFWFDDSSLPSQWKRGLFVVRFWIDDAALFVIVLSAGADLIARHACVLRPTACNRLAVWVFFVFCFHLNS